MQPPQIDLTPSRALSERLFAIYRKTPAAFAAACRRGNRQLEAFGNRFEKTGRVHLELSALLLRRQDVEAIAAMTETLHTLVERALGWLLADQARLARHFPDHRRVFDFFAPTRGLACWQGYSRYDVLVDEHGCLKVTELNTGCPAGLMGGSTNITETVATELPFMGIDEATGWQSVAVPRGLLVDELLEIEEAAEISPGRIAVLNDENELTHELEQIAGMLRRRGRDAVVANAADLATDGEKVKCEGRMVSLTLNKMRISTPESPHHCWKPGFEARYTAFLQGQREGRFVSLNNLPAMTIAEDKSLLGVMLEPEVFDLYNAGEQAFLQSVVLKTARLDAGAGALPGEAVADQFPQHASVVKPGNEGRGFGVVLGPHVDRDTWQQATAFDPAVPKIVQEYAAPASMPLVSSRGGELRETSMYLSLGLAVSRGKFRGIMSRISESPVTNVAKDGTVQAVFCMDERLEHETLAPTR